MTLDARARANALRLIAKYGKTISYITLADGVYIPATGSVLPTQTTVVLKAVVEDFNFRNAGAGFTTGLIREGDKQITFAASRLTFTPQSGDKMTIDGITYTAQNIKATYSGELIALYVVHGRK